MGRTPELAHAEGCRGAAMLRDLSSVHLMASQCVQRNEAPAALPSVPQHPGAVTSLPRSWKCNKPSHPIVAGSAFDSLADAHILFGRSSRETFFPFFFFFIWFFFFLFALITHELI